MNVSPRAVESTDEYHSIEHPGDPRHADHPKFLCELGRATYAAARVAGIAFDILRVFDKVASADMYDDPLGALLRRLREFDARQPVLPDLPAFIEQLAATKKTRNDLIHALPTLHGLHRRTGKDLFHVRNFFTVEDLRTAAEQMETASARGNRLLYHDGGAAVKAWYTAGGT